ncbi:MAG: hypothetical protein KDA80_09235 [Planctomycetaceae bacterium]|nr:hypothetical protein [Planctomycetaceae bacterium]
MKLAQISLLFTTALTLWGSSISYADDKPAQATQQQQIDEWVLQLGHERLTERIKAEKQLITAGKEAIPALAKAALAGNRDTIEKSIDVLGKLAQSKDEETKEAARITLQMLSESDQPSTAERAKIALNTKEADGIKPFEGWDKPGNQFAGGGQMSRSVSVSSINGVRTINVKEGPLETTLQELPGGKIRAKITGGEKPVELVAKNAADLEQKLPEAAALYEQYASGDQGPAMLFPGFGSGNVGVGGQQAFSSTFSIQGGGTDGATDCQDMLRKQLTELKDRMKGNPVMQQMLDQQIRDLLSK